MMPWIERDGEWELERLLLEWGKSGQPIYGDKPGSKLDDDWMNELVAEIQGTGEAKFAHALFMHATHKKGAH